MKLFFVVLLISSIAQANKVGNGGNVVRCKNKTSLLDFYELDVRFRAKGKGEDIAKERFENLRQVSPKLADQYLKRLSEVINELEYRDDIEITDVQDSLHLFKPKDKNCKVVQIAVRRNLKTEEEKRFLVRRDYWKELEPAHQSGLLTHEIIYEHLFKLGESDSFKARRINAYLYSKKFETKGFWKLLKELEVPIYP